jgi:hypothetical protein
MPSPSASSVETSMSGRAGRTLDVFSDAAFVRYGVSLSFTVRPSVRNETRIRSARTAGTDNFLRSVIIEGYYAEHVGKARRGNKQWEPRSALICVATATEPGSVVSHSGNFMYKLCANSVIQITIVIVDQRAKKKVAK